MQHAGHRKVLWADHQNVPAGERAQPAHIHVLYNGYNAVIDIQTQQVIEGDLPAKGLALAQEWAAAYRKELLDIWETQQFRTLPPLH